MRILIIGSGGREHAFATQISASPQCDKLFVAPGNAGTAQVAENVTVDVKDFDQVTSFVLENDIGLVVVGPEVPLVDGLADRFQEKKELQHVLFVGPGKKGAMLEGSKNFAKAFMRRHSIPTAGYRTFNREQLHEARDYLASQNPPYVLKADGLAAGKGVLIFSELKQAQDGLEQLLAEGMFGDASKQVVIEEFLSGIELSVFVLTDGRHYIMLPEAKDYKRIGENDTGPNTGGMGAVSPVPFARGEFLEKVENKIIRPTIDGLASEGISYIGFIFIGLMNVNGEPYVIEYNVRMGDPETQAVFPRIKTDLTHLLIQAASGQLDQAKLDLDERTAATVVMVSGGYPGSYEKGKEIIMPDTPPDDVFYYHAGTAINQHGKTVTSGGRVLAVTAMGPDISTALAKAYQEAKHICWDEVYYRKDIGQDLLKFSS